MSNVGVAPKPDRVHNQHMEEKCAVWTIGSNMLIKTKIESLQHENLLHKLCIAELLVFVFVCFFFIINVFGKNNCIGKCLSVISLKQNT